jgi:hypothetical protein
MKIFKPKDVKKHSAPNICPTHEWQKNKPFFEQPTREGLHNKSVNVFVNR